jgi:predicted lipoprotein with Yx(FWY)xxD motif
MRRSPVLWASAFLVALLVVVALVRHHREYPSGAGEEALPYTTPRGITLQALTAANRPLRRATATVVYADDQGRTLYTRSSASGQGGGDCAAGCGADWLPAVARPGAQPTADWTLKQRPDKTNQWALHGAPVYRFAKDQSIGDAKGDGENGGAWRVAAFRPGADLALPVGVVARELGDAGGVALTDADGMTLYAAKSGTPGRPACVDKGCFRPLQAADIANSTRDFTVVQNRDGISQWAYRGRPLSRFDGDRMPGEVNGAGIDSRYEVALIARHFMPANVTIRRSTELGNILVTTDNRTLYQRDRLRRGEEQHEFRIDHGPPALGRALGTLTCDDACAKTWPPLLAPADALPSGYWDVATRPDGGKQWVFKGYALYTYAPENPGDIVGNQTFDLAQVPNKTSAASANGGSRTVAELTAPAPDESIDPTDTVGAGVGALFWRAVVP